MCEKTGMSNIHVVISMVFYFFFLFLMLFTANLLVYNHGCVMTLATNHISFEQMQPRVCARVWSPDLKTHDWVCYAWETSDPKTTP